MRMLLLWLASASLSFGSVQYSFTNFAGLPGYFNSGTNNGTGASARFNLPSGIAVDSAGNVFVADQNNSSIRRITPAGLVSTLAGNPASAGDQDGTNSAALFSQPSAVAVDAAGNVFVADTFNNTIRRVSPVGTNWVVKTLAGSPGMSGSADGTNGNALFSGPTGLTVDGAGNVYVADTMNLTIRKVRPVGTNWVVTTIAGSPGNFGSADGTNSAASFSQPADVDVDTNGVLYVSDTMNNAIRKITPSGTNWVVTTLASSIEAFSMIAGLSVDGRGNVFVADPGSFTIHQVTDTGVITTVGGSAGVYGTNNGTGAAARFYGPMGVAVDTAGNLYVADTSNNRISKGTPGLAIITPSPLPSATAPYPYSFTLSAIGGQPPYAWSLAAGSLPSGLTLSTNGVLNGTPSAAGTASFDIQVTDTNHQSSVSTFSLTVGVPTTPMITTPSPLPDGIATKPYACALQALGGMTPYAWTLTSGFLPPGLTLATNGVLSGTPSVTTNALFAIRVVGTDGRAATNAFSLLIVPPSPPTITTTTLPAGKAYVAYAKTLTATGGTAPYAWSLAGGSLPAGLTLNTNGVLAGTPFVAGNVPISARVTGADGLSSVKQFALNIATASAGYYFSNYAGFPGSFTFGTNDGFRTAARFYLPRDLAMDSAGNLFITDTLNSTIRRMDTNGLVTTIAGSPGQFGTDDGAAALFAEPAGAVLDDAGNLYVTDAANNTIRKVAPQGASWITTTIAGSGVAGHADGTNLMAQFNRPTGIARDSAGNLYVADTFNCTIRKVSPAGTNWVVTTIAGASTAWGSADGTNGAARFSNPEGVTVAGDDTLFVADTMNNTIRKIRHAGTNWIVTTIAGDPLSGGGWVDGTNGAAQFVGPLGITADGSGNLFVTETLNYTVRALTPVGTDWVTTTVGGMSTVAGTNDGMGEIARFSNPAGIVLDAAGNLLIADTANNRISQGVRVGPPEIPISATLAPGVVGAPYSQFLTATRGTRPLTWALASGRLPPGLTLRADGLISGTPTAGMNAKFTVKASGADGLSSPPCQVSLLIVPLPGQYYSDYSWTSFAGQPGGVGNCDGDQVDARFSYPRGVAVDGFGNVYIAEYMNQTVRKATPEGLVTRIIGSPGSAGSNDGAGSSARLNSPWGVAVDGNSNVFVADRANNRIRKMTPDGMVSTLAGSGQPGYVDGAGGTARFNFPQGVAADSFGNVFVADTDNHIIRKIAPDGQVTTLAGSPNYNGSGLPIGGFTDGIGSAARFRAPHGLAADGSGDVYVADSGNNCIRKITPGGVVTTLAGNPAVAGCADGTGPSALFSAPASVALDDAGNIIVADLLNHTIRKVSPTGVTTTIAGNCQVPGSTDGFGTNALLFRPLALALDSNNNIYVAEDNQSAIRKISPVGEVTHFVGRERRAGETDGLGDAAMFYGPRGVATDAQGNIYASSYSNIRKITPAGDTTTWAGRYTGHADGTGTNALFFGPAGMDVAADGTVYVADAFDHTIRKITPDAVVTTLAGNPDIWDPVYHEPEGGYAEGTNNGARFNTPASVAVDAAGNVFVADTGNSVIRKITPGGVTSLVAGLPGASGHADGVSTDARFFYPQDVTSDGKGNLFVADTFNHVIRQVTPAGVVSTVAGLPGIAGSTDGVGSSARFCRPSGIQADAAGNLFVADGLNHTIRMITPEGIVSTIGGTPGVIGGKDGLGPAAAFSSPADVAVGPGGLLYVANSGENHVMKGIPSAPPVITMPATLELAPIYAPYNLPLTISGGAPPCTWYLIAGNLPPGLTLGADGVIRGTPTTFTNATFTVCVIGADGLAFANVFNLEVNVARPGLTLNPTNGTAHLSLYGSAGFRYVVEASSNLVHWLPVVTNTLPESGSLWIGPASAPDPPAWFFRARSDL